MTVFFFIVETCTLQTIVLREEKLEEFVGYLKFTYFKNQYSQIVHVDKYFVHK